MVFSSVISLMIKQGAVLEENMFYGKPGSDDAGVLFARKANELHIGNEAGKNGFFHSPGRGLSFTLS